jgi:hypothetical protein
VRARSELFTDDVFVDTITLASGATLATRTGALPEAVLAGLGVLAAVRAGHSPHRAGGHHSVPKSRGVPA